MTAQTILPANTLSGGDLVTNSAVFNDASPDILKNGTESDGNRKVWTISMWIKRSKLGVRQSLWSWGSNSSSTGELYIDANDFLVLNNDGHQGSSNEVAGVLRDTSAWYHIVWRCDVTESNNIDRWRCYINGVQRLLTDAASVSNADGEINKNGTHQNWIGGAARSLQSGNAVYPFGGYIAEAVFVDGQALAPTSFGEFDEDTPTVWKPINVSGLTFGNEGVYLNFKNATELGTDVSGNGNTYAETGLTAANQSTDTCQNNFATWNPLRKHLDFAATFSEGNTTVEHGQADNNQSVFSTMAVSTGKWYAEFQCSTDASNFAFGIARINTTNDGGLDSYPSSLGGVAYAKNGEIWYTADGDQDSDTGTTYAHTDIIGILFDLDNTRIYFYKNDTLVNSGGFNYSVGTAVDGSILETTYYFAAGSSDAGTNPIIQANFGGSSGFAISSAQSDPDGYGNFEFATKGGYALCTKNLAEYG